MTDFLKRNSLWFFLVFVALAVYFLPITIPSDIKSLGKVYSPKQYILYTANDGQVRESLINLATGMHEGFSAREMERGDDIRLRVNPDISNKEFISKHDTLAHIFSFVTAVKLNSLKSELEVINALLAAELSGNKAEDIELAKKRREYARMDAEIQEKAYRRQKYLYENEVIADQEFEDQGRLTELKKIQVAIREAELQSLASGAKPEQINFIKAQIRKVKADIADLELKSSNQTITSPINGIFCNTFSPDTILVIKDIDELIIKIPVEVKDIQNVFIGQRIICKVDGRKGNVEAEVTHISKNVSVISSRQIVMVTGRFLQENPKIMPAIVVRVKLERDPVLLRDFLVKWFAVFFSR
ncbi:MAG: hypothetical protein B6D64_03995 [Bacteroidetes bacterium 4484_276]|nr:MAG: hypothetical protein B6D64_03995 [Bacteroidetes bacterium 4484_276]